MQKYKTNYIDGLTAAELIYSRQKTTYGLGKMVQVTKFIRVIAKNYLTEKELSAYCFLDYAELQAID